MLKVIALRIEAWNPKPSAFAVCAALVLASCSPERERGILIQEEFGQVRQRSSTGRVWEVVGNAPTGVSEVSISSTGAVGWMRKDGAEMRFYSETSVWVMPSDGICSQRVADEVFVVSSSGLLGISGASAHRIELSTRPETAISYWAECPSILDDRVAYVATGGNLIVANRHTRAEEYRAIWTSQSTSFQLAGRTLARIDGRELDLISLETGRSEAVDLTPFLEHRGQHGPPQAFVAALSPSGNSAVVEIDGGFGESWTGRTKHLSSHALIISRDGRVIERIYGPAPRWWLSEDAVIALPRL